MSQNTRATENDVSWFRVTAQHNIASLVVENADVSEFLATYFLGPTVMVPPAASEELIANMLFEMITRQTEVRFIT